MHAHPHPKNFLIAHHWVDGIRNPCWGALSDGPCDRADMLDFVLDAFRDTAPTLTTLWVMQFSDDVPPRDVTEDFILEWEAAHAPNEDEMIEQARCDAADDWVKLRREGASA